jgi:hypothetical protein
MAVLLGAIDDKMNLLIAKRNSLLLKSMKMFPGSPRQKKVWVEVEKVYKEIEKLNNKRK